ncbi:hypothetical protein J8L84_15740 [Alteromonas sp. MMG017]|uniref:hypothetical protein n=1 Tax=Alteromonas sp. MMG017 TaxID=2822692 RepID=UPI001B3A24E6|nr:hypothetical protein [Alteromonas sp. MMG017]MBQ4830729.1 hypothetical protein [Alteromonas sp. MMG017]
MRLLTRLVAFSALCTLCLSAYAFDDETSPKDTPSNMQSDMVIATWHAQPQAKMTVALAQTILNKSRYPDATGNERQQVMRFIHYQKQQKNSLSASTQIQLKVLEARVLQGTHQFSEAEAILNKIKSPLYAPALLLLADINIQQGAPAAAKNLCQQLIGKTSYLLAFTCILNAEFTLNTNTASYEKLLNLEAFAEKSRVEKPSIEKTRLENPNANNTAQAAASERLWYYETLAAMAYTLNKPEATLLHLKKVDAQKLPVSALLLWADAKLKLSKPQDVIQRFTAIQAASNRTSYSTDKNIDDGLLLRWAKAERQLSLHDTEIQKQLADRMALRTWREDVSHAAQVASYFLDIDYKPAIALKFARLNWQAAQTRSDARLLARAESAVATSSTLN